MKKTVDPNDRRKNYLSVNEDVIPQYKVYRQQDRAVIQKITESYSEKEIQKFCEMLNILSAVNFEEIDGDTL